MTLEERRRALATAALFAGLETPVLQQLALGAHAYALSAGATLPLQERDAMFLVVDGSVKLSLISSSGREYILGLLGRAEIWGEAPLAMPGPPLVATAQERSSLLCLSRASLSAVAAQEEVLRRLNQLLSERVRELLELLEDLALHPLDTRLARVIMRLQRRSRTHAASRLHRCSQTTLAQMANATRPKVNRELHRLQQQGLIDLERGIVAVRSAAGLERLAHPVS